MYTVSTRDPPSTHTTLNIKHYSGTGLLHRDRKLPCPPRNSVQESTQSIYLRRLSDFNLSFILNNSGNSNTLDTVAQ